MLRLTPKLFIKEANSPANLGLTKGQLMNKLSEVYTDMMGNPIKKSPVDNDRKVAMAHYFVGNKNIKKFLDAQPDKIGRKQKTFDEHIEYLRSVGKNDAADRYVKLAKTEPEKAKNQVQALVPRVKAQIKDPKKYARKQKKSKTKFYVTKKGQEAMVLDRAKRSGSFPYGTNPAENVYGQLMRAAINSKNQGRIQFVNPQARNNFDSFYAQLKKEIKKDDKSKPKMEALMQKYKLKDTLAIDAVTKKPAASFNLGTLEKFMENSLGRGLGNGSFDNAKRTFAFRDFLKNYQLPDGTLLNTRIGRLQNSKDYKIFNVHHYDDGLQVNPYSTQVVLRQPNEELSGLISTWNTQRNAVGTQGSRYKTVGEVDDEFTKVLDSMPGGIQTTNQYTGELIGVSPTVESLVSAAYKGANRSKEKRTLIESIQANPTFVQKFKDDYADGGSVGIQPVASPTQKFDIEVKQMMETTGLDFSDAIIELMKDNAKREKFNIGGMVGGNKKGFALDDESLGNKVGALESLLAGIGSGLIDIPKGAFTLGGALMDVGFGTNNSAKMEAWFDDLTDFDEKAEQHWLGSFARIATNLGVPGAYGFKAGERLARNALLAKRNGNYFKLTDPVLQEKFKTSLNAKGRLLATLGGAAGVGATDAIFVGDPEGVGTMGDMIGMGPTELDPNDENLASREIANRVRFGVDGALFLGLIGGTGSAIKSLARRRDDLASNNDAIDKFFSTLRPRGKKSQAFFDMERQNIGARAGDINFAGEQARKLDKHIDAIFPFVKTHLIN